MKKTRALRATAVLKGTSFRNVRFKNIFRAESALEHLRFTAQLVHRVSLRDFYEIAWCDRHDQDWNMTDSEGWTSMASAKIVPIKYGYMIELPKTVKFARPTKMV